MNQIITQHGWGLDQSFWDIHKVDFENNNWSWQDNERGYFSKKNNQSKWIKNSSNSKIKMVLCHSLGFHLVKKSLLKEATHIVLINSFNKFLPTNQNRYKILRSLKRMEKKILNGETKDLLQEFIKRSFMPNNININFKNIFLKSLESLNSSILLKDLKKLYEEINLYELFNKNCKIIFIKSENDLILDKNSSYNFFESLNKIHYENITLLKLSNQGHCLTNLNLYEIIIKNL